MKPIVKFVTVEGNKIVIVPTNNGEDTLLSYLKGQGKQPIVGEYMIGDLPVKCLLIEYPDGIRSLTVQYVGGNNTISIVVFTELQKRELFDMPYKMHIK